MAYIGKTPVIGNFVKLDAITAVNGQAAYTMQNGGSNFTDYESVNQFLVSLNGTIQAPTDSFTVSGSTLTFASNLSTGDVIDFIIVFGNSLSAGTPTDGTVTNAKISYPLNKSGAIVSTFNRTSSDGQILELQKDGTAVGNINAQGGDLAIGNGEGGLQFIDGANARVRGFNASTNAKSDNDVDLGDSTTRFKDLYLSGNIYIGGTGSSNALDDYEEGTFTPTWTSNVTVSVASGNYGYYTKIGDEVTVHFGAVLNSSGGTPNYFSITNAPFQSNLTNGTAVGSAREYGQTGHQHMGTIGNNSTTVQVKKYDSTAVANPYLACSITYRTD